MSKPKITAKQEGGDDGYCYVIRVNGLKYLDGLTKREVPHYKKQALDWYERGQRDKLRHLVFEAMDNATDNGFFGPDDKNVNDEPVTPEAMAADMCDYNPDIEGKYTPAQVLPYINEWITKRNATAAE